MSNRSFALNSPEEHTAWLFAIAQGDESEPESLTDEDRGQLERIRATLDTVDRSWSAERDGLDRLGKRIFSKLVEMVPPNTNPADITEDVEVRTLGELARSDRADLPEMPEPVRSLLLQDKTALELLTDPATRPQAAGAIITSLSVPRSLVAPFLNWLNSRLNELIPVSSVSSSGYAFTRKPHGPSKMHSGHKPSEQSDNT